jgi:WhiB family transcriptional regulator, redox-sensing transcriptional regulator
MALEFLSDQWEEANCNHPIVDPEVFFDKLKVDQAKRICEDCPVKMLCLDYAIKNQMTSGVWGGLSEEERKELCKKNKTQSRKGIANQKH